MGNIVSYLFFGAFALGGIGAFIGSSYEPMMYLLKYGRWKEPPTEILFGCIFLLTHGGIGFAGLYYTITKPSGSNDLANSDISKPWLGKTYWSKPIIESCITSTATMVRSTAKYFSFVSIIATIVVFECVRLGELQSLYGLAFPILTYLLFIWASKLSRQISLYGTMPLELDPYPGSIGGQLGGKISIKRLNQDIRDTKLKLSCIRYYQSGDDSRESIEWVERVSPMWRNTIDGHELDFYYDLPEGLIESQPNERKPYHAWKLNLAITLQDGTIIERDYSDIPVFSTAEKSHRIRSDTKTDQKQATQAMHDKSLDLLMPFKQQGDGSYQIHYPAGRNTWSYLFVAVGGIFIVTGLLIPDLIFNIFFPFIGGLAFLGGVYSIGNSLTVRLNPISIETDRYLFGFLIKSRSLTTYDIKEFKSRNSHSTTSGKKSTQYYDLIVIGNNKEKLVLVENIEGAGQEKVAIERIKQMINYKS